jgi:transposase
VSFQLLLTGFDGTVDPDRQHDEGLAGGNQQALDVKTDAIAHNRYQQLSLWATASEKSTDARAKTMGETVKSAKPKRKYYQPWPAYNPAQVYEKELFQYLLHDLCAGLEWPPRTTRGRRPHPLADVLYSMVFKVYVRMSARRSMSDLRDARDKGHLSRLVSYNSLCDYFEMPVLTECLQELIPISAMSLREVEDCFAVDSSGFRTVGFVRWFNARYGKEQENHDWKKLHICVGTLTHIITSAEVSSRHAHDSPYFKSLINAAAQGGFQLSEVSADKAYSSRPNLRLVTQHGGTPYIDFKDNAKGGSRCEVWNKTFLYYSLHAEEFYEHYHRRSNAETTFQMIKSKFDEQVRSKTPTSQVNEVLCKVLCHNICCLIQSIFEFGIEPIFGQNGPLPEN